MSEHELAARIERLEAEMQDLRRVLDREKTRFGSMRDTRRCPACGGGSLFHFLRAKESTDSGPVDLALDVSASKWLAVFTRHAPLEAFACRGCALVEWHAIDFDGVIPDGVAIVAIEPDAAPPASGPFR